jgi:1,4-alpha-glucan branching enzyme
LEIIQARRTIMILKEPSPRQGHVRVIFEIPASLWADHIYLVGDFNNWDRRTLPFQRGRDGVWRVTLDLPARRHFEFRYLIDDHWCTDYHADGCATSREQEANSTIETTLPLESLAGATGHGLVHEAAFGGGFAFTQKQNT